MYEHHQSMPEGSEPKPWLPSSFSCILFYVLRLGDASVLTFWLIFTPFALVHHVKGVA